MAVNERNEEWGNMVSEHVASLVDEVLTEVVKKDFGYLTLEDIGKAFDKFFTRVLAEKYGAKGAKEKAVETGISHHTVKTMLASSERASKHYGLNKKLFEAYAAGKLTIDKALKLEKLNVEDKTAALKKLGIV